MAFFRIKPNFLPSVFTSGNLFCGMLAIIEAANGHPVRGAWLVILASFFDAIDGAVARLTNQTSRFGVELDSLSDVVSFVVAPMMLIYPLALKDLQFWGIIIAFAFVATGAIRLARFNVEQKNLSVKGVFYGLPTPAAGGLVVSYIIFCRRPDLPLQLHLPGVSAVFILLLALLMVSDIEYPPLPKLAARSLSSLVVYLLLLLSVIVFIVGVIQWRMFLFFPILMVYILFGLARHLVKLPAGGRWKRKKEDKGANR